MRLICITGGVLSGIGKGITGASLGALLTSCGYRVFMQKFDGYLNVDAGKINPFKHGECFVTADGKETDLDIGHYERFIDRDLTHYSSYTMGRLYQEIIQSERLGEYEGHDIQMIPHMSNLIKQKILAGYVDAQADIGIIEIGGTVGDMENEILIESLRQLRAEYGPESVIFVHITYIPYILASKELKTKPTQNSVKDLRSRGITPDMLVLRADYEIPNDIRQKVSLMCGIAYDAVIPLPTLASIYQVPEHLDQYRVLDTIHQLYHLPLKNADLTKWRTLTDAIDHELPPLTISLIAQYADLEDSYYSLNEGLKIAGRYEQRRIKLNFIDAQTVTPDTIADLMQDTDAICIPGCVGTRGKDGILTALTYARTHDIPCLAVNGGAQLLAIECAQNVIGYADATSSEYDLDQTSAHHIVIPHDHLIGKARCTIKEHSLLASAYQDSYGTISRDERFRHTTILNPDYLDTLQSHGCEILATYGNHGSPAIWMLRDHPFMYGVQFHLEFTSRPMLPHPILVQFVRAAIANSAHPH